MSKKLSKSLKIVLVVFGLYGLTFPVAAVPDLVEMTFINAPNWWYAYLIVGGVVYFVSLYGISRWQK